jgi:NAD+ synthase
MYELSEDYAKIRKNVVEHSTKHLKEQGVKCLVIGISGGIDSALVAALMKETGIPVVGVRIPLYGNEPDELGRAYGVAKYLCDEDIHVRFLVRVVEKLIEEVVSDNLKIDGELCSEETMNIRKGNIKARARMIQLFDIARANDGLVLSTDNLTELLLGFWTLHGDVGNFGPIQQLWKTEVYGLAEYMVSQYVDPNKAQVLQECIDAIPTDGLGITKSDFDQIIPGQDETKSPKERYREVDELLIKYLQVENILTEKLVNHPVIRRHIASEFKRRDPVNLSRDLLV